MEKLIKKTKAGLIIKVKNGILKADNKMAGSLQNVPESIKKICPEAEAIIIYNQKPIVFFKNEVEEILKLTATLNIGFSNSTKKRIKTEKENENINYLNIDINTDPNFKFATENQFNIYKD